MATVNASVSSLGLQRSARAWIGAGVGVAGVALGWVWAPAAVGVSFVGLLMALVAASTFNTFTSRCGYHVALAAHCAAVGLGSGRPGLSLVPFLALFAAMGSEGLIRRRGYHFGSIVMAGGAAAVVTLALQWPTGSWGWAVAPSLLLVAAFVAGGLKGSRDFANNAKPSWRIQLGEAVPDFEAPARLGGAPFRLSDEKGRFVLLCFLRGDWCPICQIKMRLYQRDAPELARHDVKLVAVSPSSGPAAENLARAMGIDFTLLVDPSNHIAALFGAVQPKANRGVDAPLPASFLIDPQGRLQHASKPDDIASFLDPQSIVPIIQRASAHPPPPA